MTKRIPYSVSSFERMITNDYYYVDKTMMIKDLLDASLDGVTLVTRPRRFGKSLNMSMLECFLDIERKDDGMSLFDGLAISSETEFCKEYMHKYPVIHVSFKDAVGKKKEGEKLVETAMRGLKETIGMLAMEYDYLGDSNELSENEKLLYKRLTTIEKNAKEPEFAMSDDSLERSLATLSLLLKKHHGKPAVILIDEYDVPLNTAFELGYYEYFIGTYRSILSTALKENDSLAFAVVTGCLRISKESIFTGVNHFSTIDVMNPEMDEYFGFNDDEVAGMLEHYGLSAYHENARGFYDGYRFGSQLVYNPWSIIQFVKKAVACVRKGMSVEYPCEWLNSSSNDIMKRLLRESVRDSLFFDVIEKLGNGEEVTVRVIDQLTFDDMYDSHEGLWTVLLHAGYLTCTKSIGDGLLRLKVPNEEVMWAFDQLVVQVTKAAISRGDYLPRFCDAVETFDPARIETRLNAILSNAMGLRDTATKAKKENYYLATMNTALLARADWKRRSNPESGDGFADIMVENDGRNWGIVFELKYSDSATDFKKALDEGEGQIFKRRYPEKLHRNGRDPIHLYSIAFHGKKCKVREVFEKDHPTID